MKAEIRQQLRSRRDAYVRSLESSERVALENRMTDRLLAFLPPGILASYIAMGSEIDPATLHTKASPAQAIALPWFADRAAPMIFRRGQNKLEPGPYGIAQPPAFAPEVIPDVLIVPLLGADLTGNRIGQGAGHYDRALTDLRKHGRIIAIGVAWEVQLLDSIAADEWDQPLDVIVTPDRAIEVQG